jgi:hypothetical protein
MIITLLFLFVNVLLKQKCLVKHTHTRQHSDVLRDLPGIRTRDLMFQNRCDEHNAATPPGGPSVVFFSKIG